MPKRASDQCITYRIELQDTERRLLQNYVDAYTLEQVATPIVEILKDASALYAVVTLIELLTDIDFPIPTIADTGELWDAIADAVREARTRAEEAGDFYSRTQLGPLSTILRGLDILREGTGGFTGPDMPGGVTQEERAAAGY